MKSKFNLKYKTLDKANTKYRDSAFNEKRIWISRLVAQLLNEDAIIICIDESNFRHDALPGKQWQFDMNALQRSSLKRCHPSSRPALSLKANLLLRTDEEIEYG
jgi:hypothetical protein